MSELRARSAQRRRADGLESRAGSTRRRRAPGRPSAGHDQVPERTEGTLVPEPLQHPHEGGRRGPGAFSKGRDRREGVLPGRWRRSARAARSGARNGPANGALRACRSGERHARALAHQALLIRIRGLREPVRSCHDSARRTACRRRERASRRTQPASREDRANPGRIEDCGEQSEGRGVPILRGRDSAWIRCCGVAGGEERFGPIDSNPAPQGRAGGSARPGPPAVAGRTWEAALHRDGGGACGWPRRADRAEQQERWCRDCSAHHFPWRWWCRARRVGLTDHDATRCRRPRRGAPTARRRSRRQRRGG